MAAYGPRAKGSRMSAAVELETSYEMGHPSSIGRGCSGCIPPVRKGKVAATSKVLVAYFSSVKCNESNALLLKGVVVYVREIHYPTHRKVIESPEILDIL